jgi:hypothetical protein
MTLAEDMAILAEKNRKEAIFNLIRNTAFEGKRSCRIQGQSDDIESSLKAEGFKVTKDDMSRFKDKYGNGNALDDMYADGRWTISW